MKKFLFPVMLFTILVAACTPKVPSTPADTLPPMQSAAGDDVPITISNFAFDPAALEVKVGTTVTWTNNDSVGHTVTADDGAFNSGILRKGDTFLFTFTTPGAYAYYCKPHGGPGGEGMSATITVAP